MEQKADHQLKQIAAEIRYAVIETSHRSKSAHLASCLSCVDIITELFWRENDLNFFDESIGADRDHFILSKGHAAMLLYVALAKKGIFDAKELLTYNQNGGRLAEHPPANLIPYIDVATGSLGHGLSVGVGISMAKKLRGCNSKVIVVVSDGEINEGSVWEATMFASRNLLNNLCLIVDSNKWQATDRVEDVLHIDNLADKWAAFGWKTIEVNGHNFAELRESVEFFKTSKDRPVVIIANTIKGRGISFMEDDNNWHYRSPNEQELSKCKKELFG